MVRRPTADRQIPRSNRGRTSYFFFTSQSPTDEHRLPPTADRPTADRRHRPPPTTPSSRPPTFTIAAVVARRLLLRRRPTARPPPDRPNDRPTEPPRRRHCRRRDHPQPVKNRDSVCNHEPACRIFLVPRVSTFFVSTPPHSTALSLGIPNWLNILHMLSNHVSNRRAAYSNSSYLTTNGHQLHTDGQTYAIRPRLASLSLSHVKHTYVTIMMCGVTETVRTCPLARASHAKSSTHRE